MDTDTVSAAFSLLALLAPIVAFCQDGGDPARACADVALFRSSVVDAPEVPGVLALAMSRDMRIGSARLIEGAIDACVEDAELVDALSSVIEILDPGAERTRS